MLDKVWLGENKLVGIAPSPSAFPIIIVTNIVSPTALPSPKTDAPNRPDFPYGNTAILIISNLVAPRLKAASRCELGTALITSRAMDETVGIIMIARTIPAVKTSRPNGVFAKKGTESPKALLSGTSIKSRIQNLKTKRAQSPYMMLGTAASNSITNDNGVASLPGEISEIKVAIPKLIGTPIAMAIPELTRVPIT